MLVWLVVVVVVGEKGVWTYLRGEVDFNGLDADVLRTGSHGGGRVFKSRTV